MARLQGVDLPREKRIEIALTYIFGIGRTRATETLAATGIDPSKRVHELTDDDLGDKDPQPLAGAAELADVGAQVVGLDDAGQ